MMERREKTTAGLEQQNGFSRVIISGTYQAAGNLATGRIHNQRFNGSLCRQVVTSGQLTKKGMAFVESWRIGRATIFWHPSFTGFSPPAFPTFCSRFDVAVVWKLCRFFRVPIKAIGKNEKSRCPKPDEDAEPLCMRLSFGCRATVEIPDGD